MNFCKGDKVKVVDDLDGPRGINFSLRKGKTYIVRDIDNRHLWVEGISFGYFKHRFRKVEDKKDKEYESLWI